MIPQGLRTWFIVHFLLDVVFAIPLYVAPEAFLALVGWHSVDPLATRLVAAALFAIGIESWLGRKQGLEGYRAMLTLKVIWSAAATLGITWSLIAGAPTTAWPLLIIFAGFHVVWLRYWWLLRRDTPR